MDMHAKSPTGQEAIADVQTPRTVRRIGLAHFSFLTGELDVCSGALAALLGYRDTAHCIAEFSPNKHGMEPLFNAILNMSADAEVTRLHSTDVRLRQCDGEEINVHVSMSHHPQSDGLDLAVEDVWHLLAYEEALNNALASIGNEKGLDFIQAAVRKLSEMFDGAMVGLIVPSKNPGHFELVAAWANGRRADACCYAMQGTPCETVFGQQTRAYCFDVADLFSGDNALREMGAQSYIGVPLFDEHKAAAGVLYLISNTPVSDDRPVRSALQAFAQRSGLELTRLRHEEDMRHMWQNTVTAISTTIEKRDPYTSGHQARTADIAVGIAKALGWSDWDIEGLRMASLMHDIGKIVVPTEILGKPGALTASEYELIKSHPQAGFDILKNINFPWPIAQMVLQHHERIDGSGYPQGLLGTDTLPGARLLAVADVIESMSSDRPYRAALGMQAAKDELARGRGTLYDEAMCEVFLAREAVTVT